MELTDVQREVVLEALTEFTDRLDKLLAKGRYEITEDYESVVRRVAIGKGLRRDIECPAFS